MYRIDSAGAVSDLPEPEEAGDVSGYFSNGVPEEGIKATRVHADWLNHLQEELLSVIEYAELEPSKSDRTLLLQAIQKLGSELSATLQTTSAAGAVAHAISIPEGSVYAIEASVAGRKNDGSERLMAVLRGLFYRNSGGDVTQDGETQVDLLENGDSGWGGVDLVANTGDQTIDIEVTGKTSTTIKWKTNVRVTKVS